jgi:peptidoglycan/LPS O-acetylase OafA/YrhL
MIASLNILRGISAFLVVIFHFQMEFGVLRPYLFWSNSYYLFVDMFFILSGFIMVHVYASNGSQMTWQDYFSFMWHRFARIYPLHLLTMAFILLMALAIFTIRSLGIADIPMPDIFDGAPAKAILTNVLLIQSWGTHDDFTMNTVAWSISIEWAMYLLFPILVLGYARLSPLVILGVTSAVYLLIYYVLTQGTLDVHLRYGLLRAFAGFASGMALHKFLQVRRWSVERATLGLIFSVLTIISLSFFAPGHWTFILTFWLLIASSIQLESILNTQSRLVRLGAWLGDISYSLYLWHLIIILLAKQVFEIIFATSVDDLTTGGAFVLVLFITFAILGASYLSFEYFEKPARDLLRRRTSMLGDKASLERRP